jgi:UDP-N-acetylmuramate dehydrogenase
MDEKKLAAQQLCQRIQRLLGADASVYCWEPMSRHTTFGIGGPADCFVEVKTEQALRRLWMDCCRKGHEPLIIGAGSNLLVRDGGIRGVVVKLTGVFSAVEVVGERVLAGAAAALKEVASTACMAGLTGLEFAIGIPGSIGGAVYMNAGAYGGQMADVVDRVRVLTEDGDYCEWSQKDLGFDYRRSSLQDGSHVIVRVAFGLHSGDAEQIKATMEDYTLRRAAKQPLDLPSAGSVFKRPPGHYVGAMVEAAGLKGVRVGGAQVSEKHAGFIVNRGGASAKDVLELIELVQTEIRKKYAVDLETELKVVGED